ncbi:MAG: PKD domain-containing protein [Planctomycetota bacterium]|nr:PKD domain-containing protein [Planctomycetota bacterium]
MHRTRLLLSIVISFLICGSEVGANNSVSEQASLPPQGKFIYLKKDAAQNEQARPLQIVFFRFPASLNEQIYIRVFDPDVSGVHDLSGDVVGSTKFEIYGGKNAYTDAQARLVFPEVEQQGNLLASKTFASEFDNKWYEFGPFDVAQGEKEEEWSYFKFVAHALTGTGENRFRVEATPANAAEALCYNASVLVPKDSDGLQLYLKSGGLQIIGVSAPYDPLLGTATINSIKRKIRLSVPKQGGWARYDLDLIEEETKKRLVYSFSNSGKEDTRLLFTFTDAKGYPLPLFSSESPMAFSAPEPNEPVKHEHKAVESPVVKTNSQPSESHLPVKETRAVDPNLTFVFDASSSFDPDNDQLSFEWDFGDGSPNVQKVKANHTFERAGSYKVTLTVSDGSKAANGSSQLSQLVHVNIPPVIKAITPKYVRTGASGAFDASSSTDSPGEMLSYKWDFGDEATATDAKSNHVYIKGGTYKVRLTVSDNRNLKNSSTKLESEVVVNTPPVAKATWEKLEGTDGNTTTVILDASGSSDPDGDKLEYLWEFAGGGTMEGQRVSRTFTNSGTHTAQLVVRDNSGTPFNSSGATIQIKLNSAPNAIASVPDSGFRGEELVFDASGSTDPDGDKLSYLWSFGDGKNEQGQKVTHRYGSSGQYNVMLTVDDGQQTRSVIEVVRIQTSEVKAALTADNSVVGRPQNYVAVIEGEETGLRFQWEFGDGSRYFGKEARHKYAKAGTYLVQFTVHEGAEPAYIAKVSKTVHANTPPTPVLLTVDEPCCPGRTIRFDASQSKDADGHQLTYFWDFGDGNVSEKASPTHAYTKGGVFKVDLTVTDESGLPGSSASTSRTVNINRSPVPVIHFATLGESN